ncbi:MAG: hypothetical protein V4567_00300 [Pseudomonadota bacterium]
MPINADSDLGCVFRNTNNGKGERRIIEARFVQAFPEQKEVVQEEVRALLETPRNGPGLPANSARKFLEDL